MYKFHKNLARFIFFAVFIASYATGLQLTNDFTNHLITFFSIVFGFFFTALSVLFGTDFTKRLRKKEDPIKRTQTKLHTLAVYFNFSLLISLSSICLLLLISLMGLTVDEQFNVMKKCFYLWKIPLCWSRLLTGISLGLAVMNIMFMYLLFKVFFNGFIEESVESKN